MPGQAGSEPKKDCSTCNIRVVVGTAAMSSLLVVILRITMAADREARSLTRPNDFIFWQSKTLEERLDALEQIRNEYNR